MTSYILAHCWREPQTGCTASVVELNDEHVKIIDRIVSTLNENGDPDVVYWSYLFHQAGITGGLTYQETLKLICDESRYLELDVPGEYYNGVRIHELDELLFIGIGKDEPGGV